jgi:hypothetical protein
MKRHARRAGVAALAALSTGGLLLLAGSLVGALRHVFSRKRADPEQERVARIREAIAPITVNLDRERWEAAFGPFPDSVDLDALRASMPVLDPPLSQTIIDQRREGF